MFIKFSSDLCGAGGSRLLEPEFQEHLMALGMSTVAKRPLSSSMQIPAFRGSSGGKTRQEDSRHGDSSRFGAKPPVVPQPPSIDSDSFFASLDANRPAEPAPPRGRVSQTQADDYTGAIGTVPPPRGGVGDALEEALEGQSRIQAFMERNDLIFSNHPRDWERSIESAWSLSHIDPGLRRANSNTLKGIAAIIADYPTDVRWAVRSLLNPNAVSSAGQAAPLALAQHLRLDPHRDVKPCLDFLAEQRALSCIEGLVQFGVPRSQLTKQFDGMSTVVTCDVVLAAADRPASASHSSSQPFSPLVRGDMNERERRHEEDKQVSSCGRAPLRRSCAHLACGVTPMLAATALAA